MSSRRGGSARADRAARFRGRFGAGAPDGARRGGRILRAPQHLLPGAAAADSLSAAFTGDRTRGDDSAALFGRRAGGPADAHGARAGVARPPRPADVPAGEHVPSDRLGRLRLRVLPVPLARRRRGADAAHPRARPPGGPLHLNDPGRPGLGRPAGRAAGGGSCAEKAGRCWPGFAGSRLMPSGRSMGPGGIMEGGWPAAASPCPQDIQATKRRPGQEPTPGASNVAPPYRLALRARNLVQPLLFAACRDRPTRAASSFHC